MVNENNLEIQEKQQKIEGVKEKFEREVLKKIGDVLIFEIGKIIEKIKSEKQVQQKNIVKYSFPNYLKPIITLLNKDNLLIETAFLYIFLNLNKNSPEYERKYNIDIQSILKIFNSSSELKNLIIANSENADNSQFFIEFQIPENSSIKINQLGENTPYFLIFGILAIIKWLGLWGPKYQSEYIKYEEYFQNYFKALK